MQNYFFSSIGFLRVTKGRKDRQTPRRRRNCSKVSLRALKASWNVNKESCNRCKANFKQALGQPSLTVSGNCPCWDGLYSSQRMGRLN